MRGWQINKMIFIGKNLNEKQLKGSFAACLAQPAVEGKAEDA